MTKDEHDKRWKNAGILHGYVLMRDVYLHNGRQVVAKGDAFDWVQKEFSGQIRARRDGLAILPRETLCDILGSKQACDDMILSLHVSSQKRGSEFYSLS